MKLRAIAESYLKRSWWVAPDGRTLDAGDDHRGYLHAHPGTFPGCGEPGAAVRAGWVRAGLLGPTFYIQTRGLTSRQLAAVQELYSGAGPVPFEYQDEGTLENYRLSRQEVLTARSPGQLRRLLLAH